VDWQTTLLLAVAFLGIGLIWLRIERRMRRFVLLVLVVPIAFLVCRWAAFRSAWSEVLISLGIASAGLAIWWATLGRKLPPPRGSTIRVLTDKDPP